MYTKISIKRANLVNLVKTKIPTKNKKLFAISEFVFLDKINLLKIQIKKVTGIIRFGNIKKFLLNSKFGKIAEEYCKIEI